MVFINKCMASLIIILYSFVLAGCLGHSNYQNADELNSDNTNIALDELEGVWIETEFETYEVRITSVRVKWYNTLNDRMMFGQPFILEKKENGIWKQVRNNNDYGFTLEGLILDSKDTRWHTYDLTGYSNGLPVGEYRISASFFRSSLDGNDYGAGNYPEYQVYT